ncbi:MAG: alpha/beta hydrolase [Planctomycetota bacterium]|jgi:pimeloyl-ACP methyl ester carboxylesterase
MSTTDWQIEGSDGKPIRATTDPCDGDAQLSLVFAHGFKGYKEYGFMPVMAREIASRLPVNVHRFTMSHSGMGEDIDTFEHPELFEANTLNREVFDVNAVVEEARRRDNSLPVVCMGHSRGGVSTLLACGRADSSLNPAGVIVLASPDSSFRLGEKDKQTLLDEGRVVSPSARTGQELYLGKQWLMEQISHPEDHDVLACAERLDMPVLVIHGDEDVAVPVSCGRAIAHRITRSQLQILESCNHVFNMPNPAGETPISDQLERAIAAVCDFMSQLTTR